MVLDIEAHRPSFKFYNNISLLNMELKPSMPCVGLLGLFVWLLGADVLLSTPSFIFAELFPPPVLPEIVT
jgi:hypothetical protein